MIIQRKSFKNEKKSMFDKVMKSAIRAHFLETKDENENLKDLSLEDAYSQYFNEQMLTFYVLIIDFAVLATINSRFLSWIWDEEVTCPKGITRSIKDHLIAYDMVMMYHYNLQQFNPDVVDARDELDLAGTESQIEFFSNPIFTLEEMSKFYEIPKEWIEKEVDLVINSMKSFF